MEIQICFKNIEKSLNFMKSSWHLEKKSLNFVCYSWKNQWILKQTWLWLTTWVDKYVFNIYIAYWYMITKLGLKRYAQRTIWYDTRYNAHDTIHLPFLPGKQRLVIPACDQKHCTPPTTTACAVMMRSGYNNGGLLGVSRCSVFVMNSLIILFECSHLPLISFLHR